MPTNTGMTRRQYERFESRRTVQARPQLVTFADHRFDAQPARYTDNWAAGAAQSFHRQPTWSNSRFRPYSVQTPDNWYLPVAPQHDYHQFIVRPQQPWMRQVVNPPFMDSSPPSLYMSSRPFTAVYVGQSFYFHFLCSSLHKSVPIPSQPVLSYPSSQGRGRLL